MIAFRHSDPRFPFLSEAVSQPPARWHGPGEGPVQYLADSSHGAWAEFLRHEGIRDAADLATVRRAMWAVDVPDDEPAQRPRLPHAAMTGGANTYATCRVEARRLRASGARRLDAPSAALTPGGAAGQRVRGGLLDAPARNGRTIVLFGPRPDLIGWKVVERGRPGAAILARVRHL